MGRTQITESLIAQILTMHFHYGMTLGDIESWLKGMGLNFAHSTVMNWIEKRADILEPLDKPLQKEIITHSDGAPMYKCYDTGELIVRIACLVHVRRPFYKLKASLSTEEEPELLKAVNYALTEYPCMLRCLEDGSLDLSNNICERQIRRIAKYRNNSFFVGSPEASVRFARLMSVFANIRNHNLDPLEYLCDVFRRIKNTAGYKLVELLAHRWQPATVSAWV